MHNRTHAPIWIAGLALAMALYFSESAGSVVQSSTQALRNSVPGDSRQPLSGFAPVVRNAAPAIVNVSSSRIVRVPQLPTDAPVNAEMLRRYFGEDALSEFRLQERREHNRGSGVIVSADGYVLTNYHMIEGATEVKVTLSDEREFIGKIVGADPGTDIAVLRISADHLPFIAFADSAKVEVGDLVLAIGNPFGVGRTVTMGIVGATGRGGLGIEDYEDFIQTDASINPGNSGGALTNARGELIGVNTAILSPSGVSLGIGFAVPSNMVHQVMDQIVRTGKVTRGFMGAVTQDVTSDLAAAMKLNSKKGALVGDVDANGPADRAGLRPGDIIVELNGRPVKESRQIRLTVGALHPGERVSMGVQRDGKPRNITFVLTENAEEQTAAPDNLALVDDKDHDVGIAVSDLTPEIRSNLNLADTVKGIFVTDVQAGSVAAEADLHAGDVIEQVNRKPVQTGADFLTELAKRQQEPLLLRVNRGGHGMYVAMK